MWSGLAAGRAGIAMPRYHATPGDKKSQTFPFGMHDNKSVRNQMQDIMDICRNCKMEAREQEQGMKAWVWLLNKYLKSSKNKRQEKETLTQIFKLTLVQMSIKMISYIFPMLV